MRAVLTAVVAGLVVSMPGAAGPDAVAPARLDGADLYARLAAGPDRQHLELPLGDGAAVTLELERFSVLPPDARFVMGLPGGGDVPRPTPQVATYRGHVVGQPGSHAFLALTGRGSGNGYVELATGERWFVAPEDAPGGARLVVHRPDGPGAAPEAAEFCAAVEGAAAGRVDLPLAVAAPLAGGPRLAAVAIDADQEYTQLFGVDVVAAEEYLVQIIAAVSDIYVRDLDVRLTLPFVRMWPLGGEPFGADSLSGFRDHWENNEDPSPYDLIHLMSGRRDTSYGGVAYVSGVCGQAYAISAYLLGAFPQPVAGSDLGNWDPVVVAHEMGHNMGTGHTHSSYGPPIDECGSLGVHARGTIMSYCHTTAGGLLNIEMRMHGRVQEVIEADVVAGGCLPFDCNGNLAADADDIAGGLSLDANGNGIPDECEDCDGNGTLDDADIAAGAPDVNANGIPDGCEPDCDGSGLPDEHEIDLMLVADANGNRIPDSCEADCDGNGIADHADIAADGSLDLDRNAVLDACQDCDGNGTVDWIDLGRPHHVFVADEAGYVREFHGASGVGIRDLGGAVLGEARGAVFGPDGFLYATSYDTSRLVRIDVDLDTATVVLEGGLLDGPAGITVSPAGDLLICNWNRNEVLAFDPVVEILGTFVSAGAGGLVGPHDLAYARNGNLLVTTDDDRVLEYDGATGAFVSEFAAAGAGGLTGARGLAVTPDGRVLVASHLSDSVIAFDQVGMPMGPFTAGPAPTGAWGVEIGPNGSVFVARNFGDVRVLEYEADTGLYIRSFIRGATGLTAPTIFAFRPDAGIDCNGNGQLDDCDLAALVELDCDGNGTPDSCDIAAGAADANGSGILDACEAIGDHDGDGLVDVTDLLAVLGAWGPCPAPCPEDGNQDGFVDVTDLLNVLANWS
jgi:hypothetical protein